MKNEMGAFGAWVRGWGIFFSLAGICVFHLANTYFWLSRDASYLIFDSHRLSLVHLQLFRAMEGASFLGALRNIFVFLANQADWHGFLVPLLTAPIFFIFGPSQDVAIMSSDMIFFPILIFSVYGIAEKLAGKRAGVLSALLVSLYPYVFTHLRIFMLEVPSAAMVALSIYLLLRSDEFRNKSFSILFGCAFGLGLLTKFNCGAFVAGPLVVTLVRLWRGRERKDRAPKESSRFFNFITAMVVAGAIFSLYLGIRWPFFCEKVIKVFTRDGGGIVRQDLGALVAPKSLLVSVLTFLHPLIWNLQWLSGRVVSFLFFVMFIVGGWVVFTRKKESRWLLLLWILVPLFLLSIYAVYEDRLMLPFVPAMAVMTSVGVLALGKKWLRRALVALMLIFGLTQYYAISIGIKVLPEAVGLKHLRFGKIQGKYEPLALIAPPLFFDQRPKHFSEFRPFEVPSGASVQEILGPILISMNESGFPAEKRNIYFFDYIPYISQPLIYEIAAREYPLDVIENPRIVHARLIYQDIGLFFDKADYFILKEGGTLYTKSLGVGKDDFFKKSEEGKAFFKNRIGSVRLIKEIPLSDSSRLFLYERV